ncbi:TraB/GumN family protein [Marinomonas sp. M1K-6]|uniref:TraB/GumN family protein n=1 Tax=Marinomonas profundi TaxID=2726122 RepID=A0A847R714_9GAMM|nr:TraB/GumN family protein [Marinomonas profundi]NLQ17886.1 TraB/GumN family protein [Marinomonas profundi]UDV03459.1 TraB/GumN family protein [Marinomonas profundi]
MNILKKLGLTLLATATLQSQAASVWKVTNGSNTLYIGGTIHLLTPQDYPLPKAYDKAYHAADKVIFETNMETIGNAMFKQDMQAKLSYADGTTIDQVISADTYQSLKIYLDARQVPITALKHLRPTALAMSLSLIELKHLGFTSAGVDQFYAQKAKQDKKPQGWLEEPESQIDVLSDLDGDDSDNMINYTLSDIKNMPKVMDDLRNSWRKGDVEAMANIELNDFQKDYPDIYHALLVKRNDLWLPQIEAMLENSRVEFVMVGAMHLAGPDSLLASLKNNGYQVSRL